MKRDTLGAQSLDQFEETQGFGALSAAVGSSITMNARVHGERLGDLDQLLLRDRQAPRLGVRRNR